MVKRILLVIGAVFVLALLWTVVSSFLGSEPAPEPKKKPEPKVKPWDGTAKHIYNLSFTRRGQSTQLNYIDFRGLERMRTTMTVYLTIIGDQVADIAWVNPKAFVVKNNLTSKRMPAQVQIKKDPATVQAQVEVTLTGVPTDLLGTSKGEVKNPDKIDPREAIVLQLPTMPGKGNVSVALTAPKPPPGHYLADPAVEERYRSQVKLSKVAVRGKWIHVAGTLQAEGAKNIVVFVDGRLAKRFPARPQFVLKARVRKAPRHKVKVGFTTQSGAKVFPAYGQRITAKTR